MIAAAGGGVGAAIIVIMLVMWRYALNARRVATEEFKAHMAFYRAQEHTLLLIIEKLTGQSFHREDE